MSENSSEPIRVLFVCLGNICRSPMAEAVFAHKVQEAGLSGWIETDSAGTSGEHAGELAHRGTRALLTRYSVPDTGHRSRVLTRADLDRFDYVLTMDAMNLAQVMAIGPGTAHVSPLLRYAPSLGVEQVPDPLL